MEKTYEQLQREYKRYIQYVAKSLGNNKFIDDLVQSGYLGLFDAYTRYEESQGTFHSYAISYIRGYMLSFLTKYARTIHIPANFVGNEEIDNLWTISLDNPLGDETNSTVGDLIAEPIEEDAFDTSALKSLLLCLKPNEVELIKMYYGIEHPEEKAMTMDEIAKQFGCTRQNIQLKIKAIMRKMRLNSI